MPIQIVYLLAVNAAIVLLVGLAVYSWTRRHVEGWSRLAFVALATALWDVLVMVMALAPVSAARGLLSLKYSMLGVTSVAMFLFVAGQTGRWRRPSRGQMAALVAIPLVGHLAAWRDGAGAIQSITFGTHFGLTAISSISFGPVYWITTAYHYGLMLASLVYVVLFMSRGGPIARGQGAALLLGVLAPGVLNVLGVAGVLPRGFDLMPFGQGVAAVALFWGALRHRMLDLVPVARHALVDALQDGILIVDVQGRVMDVNRRLAAMLGLEPGAVIGRPLDSGVIPWPEVERALVAAASGPLPAEPELFPRVARAPLVIGDRAHDVRAMAVAGTAARVLVVQDITDRQQWHDEQARLIAELQGALRQVKTLSGLLPICASCKKIRDDDGAWQPLEIYIRDRTDAKFSHGMCPSCVTQWYPGFDVGRSGQR